MNREEIYLHLCNDRLPGQFMVGILLRKISFSHRLSVKDFLMLNRNLDRDQFAMAARRWKLDQKMTKAEQKIHSIKVELLESINQLAYSSERRRRKSEN